MSDYPGAARPDRQRMVDSSGVGIAVSEWGPPDAPPLLLAHGGFDFAGTFDVFAPMLAEGGWRVVAWDQRGHGDSDHAGLYSWAADVRDALAVADATSLEPIPFVGHSKGGGLTIELAQLHPTRASCLVNIDGLPSDDQPDVPDHDRTRMLADELVDWLDHHRGIHGKQRRPGTVEELARRRGRMNPRLSAEWLQYLVTVGARRDADGWRWKIDPALRFGGFGPWRPTWSLERMAGLRLPFLAILGLQTEVMGWDTRPDDVAEYFPDGATVEAWDDVGHFVHIEQPRRVADTVLEFLATADG